MKQDHKVVRRTAVALVAGTLAAGALAGCSSKNQVPSIGYGVDAVIASYNGGSTLGANSGAAAVFSRVLTGFFYTGPDGQPVADTDTGTAKEVPGETQTIQYRLSPEGTYSDGIPTSCDDLVLTWAARSGRFTKAGPGGPVPLFDAASTDGYRDIERVDCQPGSKDATVVFRPGKHYMPWKSLFNAAELMPAHVVATQAKVANVVTPVQTGDQPTLERIADFWNNGWKLSPGKLDLTVLPSSGPYRIDSFGDKDGLVLVKNEKWWGNQPRTPRIVVWDRHSDLKSKVDDKSVGVLDVGAGSLGDVSLSGFHKQNLPGRGVEQLVLGTDGVFGSANARRAFALCVPRQALFDKFGHPEYDVKLGLGAGMLNSRTVQQDSVYYPSISGPGDKYKGGDAVQAAASAGLANQTVRIGYVKPDVRRAAMIAAIADACKPAGITVIDAGAPDFTASQLTEGKVDAILGGTAGMPGPSGTLAATDAIASLRTGAGENFGRFGNGRYDAIADQLAADDNSAATLNLLTEQENLLWGEMPSIPLFAGPRTIGFGDGMENGIASPTRAGAGWNMDRWVLKR
ncbi:ABC transporter substrate-binding protein [Nocardia seriolae]|uniref:Lipoprotein n=1 Tax=Nocardia seriolae TaxID=37332 RepID=A0ABC8AZR1_9NOCA|nr:ABC transporter substrate-binding protein [Nocardia seriolae]APA99643.1 putative lipoprotein [Nocardia seriolae]MTJ64212.1 peptide-binding protein [Nocardia seriolae]MTJ73907.1 peptide-binding protein [Nocardia seriolae]MTJ89205.1 peptide-binding protein [Nocardia seriolae]MTK33183.1 peptide-binding protein [Nocardia seriolae]